MKLRYPSLTVSIKRKTNCYFLSFKATGILSIEDYQIITPIITSALNGEQSPRLYIFIDISQFSGWTMRAAWNDFIISMKHCGEFKRVAIFGNCRWQKVLSQAGNWFIAGDLRYFDNRTGAINWIAEE